jgi:hypothetical protein
MKLRLQRHPSGPTSTIGELTQELADGTYSERWCWTCEDVVRERPGVPVALWKVPGETAIPEGTYQVILSQSTRFGGQLMPELLHVPGFTGIRIHSGNTSLDTAGCVLVGTETDGTEVLHSREAYAMVKQRLVEADAESDHVYLQVCNGLP